MGNPLYVNAGELSSEEIIEAMHDGHRVVITMTLVGEEYEVTLRHDGSVYYCDTPTRLHRHEDESEMRTCIRRMGYGREALEDGTATTDE